MEDASHFGEVLELLHKGWDSLGVDSLRQRIAESLAIRETEVSLREARTSERINRWLAILFGVIATPPLAQELIRPLWEYFDWPSPQDASGERLLYLLVSVFLVAVAIVVVSRVGGDQGDIAQSRSR